MKYSKEFERDFKWYLSMRHKFNFDGNRDYSKTEVNVFVGKTGECSYEEQKEGGYIIKGNVKIEHRLSWNSFKNIFPHLCTSNGLNIIESKGLFQTRFFDLTSYPMIVYKKDGVSAKEAFYLFDSKGEIVPTKHPILLKSLYKTKGSINLHIKMYAEDLASCNWNKLEMRALCIKFKAPNWFREAIVNQSNKLRYG